MKKEIISSGAPWENVVGYSRAVRVGPHIEISGTAPIREGAVEGDTPYAQAMVCLEIIQETLEKAGARLENVVRTRMFVTDIREWEAFARAHHEFFGRIKPATSMVEVSRLIDRDMYIEIEATALLTNDPLPE